MVTVDTEPQVEVVTVLEPELEALCVDVDVFDTIMTLSAGCPVSDDFPVSVGVVPVSDDFPVSVDCPVAVGVPVPSIV